MEVKKGWVVVATVQGLTNLTLYVLYGPGDHYGLANICTSNLTFFETPEAAHIAYAAAQHHVTAKLHGVALLELHIAQTQDDLDLLKCSCNLIIVWYGDHDMVHLFGPAAYPSPANDCDGTGPIECNMFTLFHDYGRALYHASECRRRFSSKATLASFFINFVPL